MSKRGHDHKTQCRTIRGIPSGVCRDCKIALGLTLHDRCWECQDIADLRLAIARLSDPTLRPVKPWYGWIR